MSKEKFIKWLYSLDTIVLTDELKEDILGYLPLN